MGRDRADAIDPVTLASLVVLAVLASLECAYVEWCYWGWFAVSAGAPPLGYWHVFGLGMLILMMTGGLAPARRGDPRPVQEQRPIREQATDQIAEVLGRIFVGYPLILAAGWAISKGVAP